MISVHTEREREREKGGITFLFIPYNKTRFRSAALEEEETSSFADSAIKQ